MKALIISLLFILSCTICIGQTQKPNALNPYLSSSEVMWLKKYKMDLSKHEMIDLKLQTNLKDLFQLRQKERRKKSQIAAHAAIGIMGIATGLVNDKSTFNSQSVNSILSAIGIISSGIAFKKHFERRNISSQLDQQIKISQSRYDELLPK